MKKKMEISLRQQQQHSHTQRECMAERGQTERTSLSRVHSQGDSRVMSGSSSITRQQRMVSPGQVNNLNKRFPSRNRGEDQHFLSQGAPMSVAMNSMNN